MEGINRNIVAATDMDIPTMRIISITYAKLSIEMQCISMRHKQRMQLLLPPAGTKPRPEWSYPSDEMLLLMLLLCWCWCWCWCGGSEQVLVFLRGCSVAHLRETLGRCCTLTLAWLRNNNNRNFNNTATACVAFATCLLKIDNRDMYWNSSESLEKQIY